MGAGAGACCQNIENNPMQSSRGAGMMVGHQAAKVRTSSRPPNSARIESATEAAI